ncbi:glycosyltransferase family 2 protein [Megasphaera sp.]|uniref:glycosyltransferase family A protein n=1 Tax=Megasphaera sp. TaxID=2023260 RepID=UPI00258841B4|nr:glycosyltransferase family 2 protein [Megasphaera sp.]
MGKRSPCLTILTPTYNRYKYLQKLFDSLCEQTCMDFQWLVIDDGSSDRTEDYFKNIKHNVFNIDYYKKDNGGKHTALNFSHPFIKGELVIIVDSDDVLSKDAVATVLHDWERYKYKSSIGVISYLRGDMLTHKSLARSNAPDGYISDHIAYRINRNIRGDMAEVVRTDVFKSYNFPVFSSERMVSEEWLWNHIAMRYKTVYRQKVIYYCEYIEGGLTKSGRKLLMNNPLGQMEACKSYFVNTVSTRMQIKKMLLYCVYGLCSKKNIKDVLLESGRPFRILLTFPLGWILFCYWRRKYFHE